MKTKNKLLIDNNFSHLTDLYFINFRMTSIFDFVTSFAFKVSKYGPCVKSKNVLAIEHNSFGFFFLTIFYYVYCLKQNLLPSLIFQSLVFYIACFVPFLFQFDLLLFFSHFTSVK